MIVLISGCPGSGKTAYVVDLVSRETVRPIFVLGIKGLTIPHYPVPPVEDWTRQVPVVEDPSITYSEFLFPENSIIVIDEAQNIFRPRSPSSRIPAHVSAFETHRHLGIDFYLITQKPGQIDTHVRRLVSSHIHFVQTWSGRKLWEWSEYADVDTKSSYNSGIFRSYTIPSRVFSLYESASVHTKVPRRFPVVFYSLIALLIIFSLLVYFFINSFSARFSPAATSSAAISPAATNPVATNPVSVSDPVVNPISADFFTPRLVSMPESAPIYDSVRVVTAMPVVVGCVQSVQDSGDCRCYTAQATRVLFPSSVCQDWLKNRPFNPYLPVKSDKTESEIIDKTPPVPAPVSPPISAPVVSPVAAPVSVHRVNPVSTHSMTPLSMH